MAEAPPGEYDSENESESDTRIYRNKIIKYFQVNEMYNRRQNRFLRITYLYYRLKLYSWTTYPEDESSRSNELFNSTAEHAEVTLVRELEHELNSFTADEEMEYAMQHLTLESPADDHHGYSKDKKKKMTLKIVLNYAPCKGCADTIIQFKQNFENNYEMHIMITFASFYLFYPSDDQNQNILGLANLKNAGIKLRLVWDSKSFERIVKNIGTEEERMKRQAIDRKYMEIVNRKTKEIADNMV
ncbi:hypothetical protein ACJMK2_014135 [Sinanodonta woodiana]|uniref:Uncharacterized protein n=1 Tax=Sinanodonta woodiana TaxID=1069815 RepID=A0ABD3UZN7_SINWO